MCLGSTMNFSMKMSSLPKAFLASLFTSSKAGLTSSGLSQRRMPRPPPPPAAFRITGKPKLTAFSRASSPSRRGSVQPGTMGTPQPMAICLAASLSPIRAMVSDLGPMKAMPASSQARTKSAFSERKP